MIRQEYIEKIRGDKTLRTKIMYVADKSLQTVYNWLSSNNPALSSNDVVKIICDHFGVTPDEVLEPAKEFQL